MCTQCSEKSQYNKLSLHFPFSTLFQCSLSVMARLKSASPQNFEVNLHEIKSWFSLLVPKATRSGKSERACFMFDQYYNMIYNASSRMGCINYHALPTPRKMHICTYSLNTFILTWSWLIPFQWVKSPCSLLQLCHDCSLLLFTMLCDRICGHRTNLLKCYLQQCIWVKCMMCSMTQNSNNIPNMVGSQQLVLIYLLLQKTFVSSPWSFYYLFSSQIEHYISGRCWDGCHTPCSLLVEQIMITELYQGITAE